MKKTVSVLLAALMTAAAFMLTACEGDKPEQTTVETQKTPDNTDTEGTTDTQEQTGQNTGVEDVTVPDVTMNWVAADVYVNAEAVEATGYKVADNANISSWFAEKKEIDTETWEVKLPAGFTKLDEYVLRIAQGQYIMEVSVLKVKDAADIEEVKAMAEFRRNKQKNNNDFKLYDDENGTNAKMIETGKVSVFGNFVVYAVTDNTEVSMLRAQSYVANHPDCSAVELYHAIVSEIKD